MTDLFAVTDLEETGDPGTSFTLTDEGWQAIPFEAPGDDWELLSDGSFRSLDGMTRSFPLDNPAGE